ncbi:hypothetical protein F949_01626 [Acinetobacter junii NIPH 182]|uniref:hypothetical protein n=1 Tax=Acinetobacter junii TaxID=40215 RepID=UPI0002CEE7A1|nr:hypothetical protein [Acinetobacter junii]ENV64237.1 hypothetical protein F949_01626 [Acinetobacter junii NIPH 182]
MAYFDWANGIEIFKALTPYILALIVYLVWHKQKEKEVIANEAKNSLAIINNLLRIHSDLFTTFGELPFIFQLYEEHEIHDLRVGYTGKILNYENKIDELVTSLDFLMEATKNKKFEDFKDGLDIKLNDGLHTLKLMLKAHSGNRPVSDKETYESDILNINLLMIDEIMRLKSLVLSYALYRK